ncbi:MAG: hypothetical protein K9L21_04495 [Spirochaetia bacterium]|nr:hypothetical protein [Spirochaetia bacterium]
MKKKILMMTGIALLAASAGLFAGNLWDQADSIADESSHIIPAVKEITYAETNGYGITVTEQDALSLFSETYYGRITSRFFGDSAVKAMLDTYSSGLVFTPFSGYVSSFGEQYSTGTIEKIDGDSCEVYYYELTIDKNGFFYQSPYTESGTVMDISGYVWISLATGAPLRVENIYSVGYLDIDQYIDFSFVDGRLIPEQIVTNGTKEKISGIYGMLELLDFTVTETVAEVFSSASYSR